MSPYNPLAMQMIRDRRAAIAKRVASGEITPEQGGREVDAFIEEMFRRRGSPVRIERPSPERPDAHLETPEGAFTVRWGTRPT